MGNMIFCRRIPFPVFSGRQESSLKQTLGFFNFAMTGISCSNLVFLTVLGLLIHKAGASAFLSCLIAALISVFPGLCYVEFATKMPTCGSVFTYTFAAIGEVAAFLVGINNLSDIVCQVAVMTKTSSALIQHWTSGTVHNYTLFQVYKVSYDTAHNVTADTFSIFEATPDWIAGLQLLILSVILIFSVHISASVINGLSVMFYAGFVAIIIACFVYGNPANLVSTGDSIFKFGLNGVMNGAALICFAFLFFDGLAVMAEEAENPQRDIPRSAILGWVFITICLVLSTLAVAYLSPNSLVDVSLPFITGFMYLDHSWAVIMFFIIAFIALAASALISIQMGSRYLYIISKDGLLPAFISYLQPRFRTPIVALAIVTVVSIILSMFFEKVFLESIMQFGSCLSFLVIGINLLVVRYLPSCAPDSELRNRLLFRPVFNRFFKDDGTDSWMKKPSFFIGLLTTEVVCIIFIVIIFSVSPKHYNPILIYSSGTIFCAMAFVLLVSMCVYQPNPVPLPCDGFTVPFLPVAPLISVALSVVLMSYLPFACWGRFFIVSAVATVFYSIYRLVTVYRQKRQDYENIDDSSMTEDNQEAIARGSIRKTL